MKRNGWNKALALGLVLVLLATTVSASGYTLDLSGDGKVNVWDLQVAVNENKEPAHQEAILTGILGNPDELHPNAEGVYEIWSATGLYNRHNVLQEIHLVIRSFYKLRTVCRNIYTALRAGSERRIGQHNQRTLFRCCQDFRMKKTGVHGQEVELLRLVTLCPQYLHVLAFDGRSVAVRAGWQCVE